MSEATISAALARAGWGDQVPIEALGVTGNNHVLRAEIGGRAVLVKEYFQHPADPRDRFNTERAFYSFLWGAGVRSIPEPIEWYPGERFALLEFVVGEKPTAATDELVEQAVAFFRALNQHRALPDASQLPLASEACFSIAEHLGCIGHRVDRLEEIAPGEESHDAAIEFVHSELGPAWMRLRARIEQESSRNAAVLPQSERCLSPSDFGFHNAILASDGRLRFFDFEYAGWDDPAKTVCDFFCQPAVPVPHKHFNTVLQSISPEFGGSELVRRASLLLPVYQTKWCCIMLNDFLPAGDRRRTFSNPEGDENARWKRQLDKARAFHRAVFP